MFRNVYFDTKKSRVYLWETIRGTRLYDVIDWTPYVFIPDSEGTVKTIDGISVSRKDFVDYKDYSGFQDNHNDKIYENNVPREIQFLAERYNGIADEDIEAPELKIYSIDIEVHVEGKGFPHANEANHPIVLINVREFGGMNITWGIKDYTGDNTENIEYIRCTSESDLLCRFYSWWNKNAPDVVTGWNVVSNNKVNARGGFDFPYLINRTKNIFGEDTDLYTNLSPINIVRCWDDNTNGTLVVNIAGVSIMDYLALYKWYTGENPENYKLDTIARNELGLGKLDYSEYSDLRRLFHENWNLYVDYNAVDNKRIEQLEDKLGYIRLAQSLSLICRCSMESYTAATSLIEGLMLTHYRRNGLCAPRMTGGNQEWFPAAFVKNPTPGRYDWVVDLDIASSYPTAIITLNMSPETYYGRLVSYMNEHGTWIDMMVGRDDIDIEEVARQETPIVEFVKKREFPVFKLLKDGREIIMEGDKLRKINKALEKGLICVAPCGSMFTTVNKGHFALVEKETFMKRVAIRKLQSKAKEMANKTDDPQQKQLYKNKAGNYHAMQWALKIILNSAYGVTGVPYSRYFNIHISEAITSCGRRAVIDGERYANQIMNNPEKSDKLSKLLSKIRERCNG